MKLKRFDGGLGGSMKGSGLGRMVNLARMRSILSVKKLRKALARVAVSASSGREVGEFRWRIEFRVFQRVRGLLAESEMRPDRKVDLALVMRVRTALHWARKLDLSMGQ